MICCAECRRPSGDSCPGGDGEDSCASEGPGSAGSGALYASIGIGLALLLGGGLYFWQRQQKKAAAAQAAAAQAAAAQAAAAQAAATGAAAPRTVGKKNPSFIDTSECKWACFWSHQQDPASHQALWLSQKVRDACLWCDMHGSRNGR